MKKLAENVRPVKTSAEAVSFVSYTRTHDLFQLNEMQVTACPEFLHAQLRCIISADDSAHAQVALPRNDRSPSTRIASPQEEGHLIELCTRSFQSVRGSSPAMGSLHGYINVTVFSEEAVTSPTPTTRNHRTTLNCQQTVRYGQNEPPLIKAPTSYVIWKDLIEIYKRLALKTGGNMAKGTPRKDSST